MVHGFSKVQKKRISLALAALLFFSQSLAFAYQGKVSSGAEGYTQTICTMYGLDTVFVPVDNPQQDRLSDCLECAVCVIQASMKGLVSGFSPNANAVYMLGDSKIDVDPCVLSSPYLFRLFQSRAPPV
ncbi:MAG: hypothetical protein GY820_23640 [Gammaproteobacteria bacterium]|nr:hypothetical protein [Gammaproteobacteria bacterium]